jgi:type I restriction enzyme, S subunit
VKIEQVLEKFDQFADAPNAVAKMRKLILQLAVLGRLRSQGDEFSFPKVRLDSLGDWAQGCGFPVAEQGRVDLPILFAKVSDMNLPGNEREILKTNHTIDEEAAKRLRVKVHPPGTVIFPKIGGAIATNKRRVLVRPTAIDNNCSGIIPSKLCSTHWLFLVLSSIDFAEYQSGTSVPAVNQGALGEIDVALPPPRRAEAGCGKGG